MGLLKVVPCWSAFRSSIKSSGDIGKHWINLTRLLPYTFEELEEDKRSSGKWTISFKLTGKAKLSEASSTDQFGDFFRTSGGGGSDGGGSDSGRLMRLGSHLPSWSLDIKVLNDVFLNRGSELIRSITYLYKKLDEGHFGDLEDFKFYFKHLEPHKPPDGTSLESGGESSRNESNDTEFTLIEQRIEYSTNDTVKLEDVVDSVDALLESSIDKKKFLEQESYMETELSNKIRKMARSLNFGDVTKSVINEFLNLLGFEQSQMDMDFNSEPDSPRKRLLRQFKKDYIASGNSIFNFEEAEPVEMEFTSAASTRYTFGDCTEDFDLSLMIQSAEKERDKVSQSLRSIKDAKILENLSFNATMRIE
ncbi:hypothetical protein LguiA_030333 [Lonicera macranthoides]